MRRRSRIILRWVLASAAVVAAGLGLLLVPLGCTTTIIPPAAPTDPAPIFLVDHGRTASLVLPDGEERLVRYAYGDWKYYALRKNDLLQGIVALLIPTQGALGRGVIDASPTSGGDAASLRRASPVFIEHVFTIDVDRERIELLRRRLDDLFDERIETKFVNERYGLTFVHHPTPYTYFHNSNHAVAAWLRDLGCEVRGPAFASRWRIGEGAE